MALPVMILQACYYWTCFDTSTVTKICASSLNCFVTMIGAVFIVPMPPGQRPRRWLRVNVCVVLRVVDNSKVLVMELEEAHSGVLLEPRSTRGAHVEHPQGLISLVVLGDDPELVKVRMAVQIERNDVAILRQYLLVELAELVVAHRGRLAGPASRRNVSDDPDLLRKRIRSNPGPTEQRLLPFLQPLSQTRYFYAARLVSG